MYVYKGTKTVEREMETQATAKRELPRTKVARASSHQISWDYHVKQLKNFVQRYDRCPTHSSKDEIERELGQWLGSNISRHKRNLLPDRRAAQLMNIHPKIDRRMERPCVTDLWETNLQGVIDYVHKHGALPGKNGTAEVKFLCSWLATQVTLKNHGRLTKERYARIIWAHPLLSERFQDSLTDNRWERHLANLESYIAEHGKIPTRSSGKEPQKLTAWLRNQIHTVTQGTMPADRLEKLRNASELISNRIPEDLSLAA